VNTIRGIDSVVDDLLGVVSLLGVGVISYLGMWELKSRKNSQENKTNLNIYSILKICWCMKCSPLECILITK